MRTWTFRLAGAVAVAAFVAAIAAPANAHVKPAPQRHYHYDLSQVAGNQDLSNAVIVGGTEIMRYRLPAGGYSPQQRADATQQRINRLLGQGPIYPSDIVAEPYGGDAVVMVKGQLLFTADQATAALNQSTPLELAQTWADRMRQVLPDLTKPTGG